MGRVEASKRRYSLAALLAAQPEAIRKHADFPRLERLLRGSGPLRRATLPRVAYVLLDEPRLKPCFLGDFLATYRLPESPFFALFLAIKWERRAKLEAARAARQGEIRATATRFPSEIRGFFEYLEAAERARNPGVPVWKKKLFPLSKKRAREMARFSLAEWLSMLAEYIEILRKSYRRIALPDTDSLLACLLLECYPDPVSGRLPTQAALKAQFRKLSKIHHPDAGGDPKRFRLLLRARDRLLAG